MPTRNYSFLLFLILCNSCIAILSRKSQPVTVLPDLPGAKVYLADSLLSGSQANLLKRKTAAEFVVRKEGFIDRHHSIVTTKRNTLGVLTYLVTIPTIFLIRFAEADNMNLKAFRFRKTIRIPSNLPLPPARKEGEKYLLVNRTALKIEKDAVIETVYVSEKKFRRNRPYSKRKNEESKIEIDETPMEISLKDFLHQLKYRDTTESIFPSFTNSLHLDVLVKDLSFQTVLPNSATKSIHSLPNPKIRSTCHVRFTILDFYEQTLLTREYPVESDFFVCDINKLTFRKNSDTMENGYFRSLRQVTNLGLVKLLEDTAFRKYLKKDKPSVDAKEQVLEIVRPEQTISRIKDLIKSAVTIKTGNGHGSGFILSESGYVVTNYHVVASAKDSLLKVIFHDGIEIPASIVRVAKEVDLALLKVDKAGLVPMNVQDADQEAELGNSIFTIGTPESMELGQSVTKGIISGFRKNKGVTFLQTDMSINAGNSGGAMMTEDGLVRGVVTSRLVGFGVEGIGFGIPSYLIFKELKIKYKD